MVDWFFVVIDSFGFKQHMTSQASEEPEDRHNSGRVVMSGTVHVRYILGEAVDQAALLRETEHYLPTAKRSRKKRKTRGSTATGTASSRSGITLLDLIEKGIIQPGENTIRVSYKGAEAVGSLTEHGTIEYNGEEFQSATAFSIFFKRRITPSKQGDDGWKSVYYNNQCLDVFRKRLEASVDDEAAPAKKKSKGRRRHTSK